MSAADHPLADVGYVSLTTYRRTGVPVPTAVWVAPALDGSDHLVVITVDGTGKTRRLAQTSRVEVRRCDVRGRVKDDAPTYRGEGVVVRAPADVQEVRRAVVAKYGWPARLSDAVDAVASRVGIRRAPRAGILLRLEREPAPAGPSTS
ncbi:PPOX class F420-dependent oxidoreductase [Phycicoccus sp. CSK15P-2]|uniref:PPOX class F420-dependent oxidoreductase n=1 Tax=Phycicoccus sp. CSK15P-2 TaxID=2807627 RepID=UPI0019501582|nr:PPOX class F420-dependent oxidoreductase [Phycicoccus sp. CSK15P-2]MBM6405299.1 PPOX class F420-dependent oxidoreductase [Phycicoccus sp. CSK15P-2]